MRLLVVSEGNSELDGSLEGLLRRLLPDEIVSERMRVNHPDLRADHGKGARYFKKAIRCMRYAEKHGFDAVVVVIDQDDRVERHKQFSDAQDNQFTFFPRAMGVAVKTFEAWILADERALTTVLGFQTNRQPNPEEMKDPKRVCSELCERAGLDDSVSDFYARLSVEIDLAILEQRCPLGFHPFAERVRGLVRL